MNTPPPSAKRPRDQDEDSVEDPEAPPAKVAKTTPRVTQRMGDFAVRSFFRATVHPSDPLDGRTRIAFPIALLYGMWDIMLRAAARRGHTVHARYRSATLSHILSQAWFDARIKRQTLSDPCCVAALEAAYAAAGIDMDITKTRCNLELYPQELMSRVVAWSNSDDLSKAFFSGNDAHYAATVDEWWVFIRNYRAALETAKREAEESARLAAEREAAEAATTSSDDDAAGSPTE